MTLVRSAILAAALAASAAPTQAQKQAPATDWAYRILHVMSYHASMA